MSTITRKLPGTEALKESQTRKWAVRSYRAGEEHEILELWRLVFQRDRSLEHWRWKFKDNPYLGAHAALACTEPEKKIVGHYSGIPIKLNFKGDALLVCQCSDLIIHPDFRRQGMFLKVAKYCHDEFRRDGAGMVFAFLSPASYPGHLRHLNWKPITHLRQYWLRLNIHSGTGALSRVANRCYRALLRTRLSFERYLLKHLPNNMTCRLTNGLTFHHSTTVPDGYDRLWDAIRYYEVLSMWKDSEYFRWRYDRNPDHDFNYFYLQKDGEILALAVVTADFGGYASICEVLVKNRNVLNGRLLINRILSWYAGGKQRKFRFIGNDVGFFEEVFANFRSEVWFGIVLCGEVFDNPELEEYFVRPSNWTLTYGDIDLV